jgi:hypothetical protein
MRTIIILSAVQTVAIAFLLLKVDDLNQVEPLSSPEGAAPMAAVMPLEAMPAEEQLRRIVREELAAWSAPGSDPRASAPTAPHTSARTDQRAQLELASRQLEQYRSQGHMSPVEMGNFQEEIAKLDPSVRKQMLINLVRAMNAGEIRGEL